MAKIPKNHPRYQSLQERHRIIDGMHQQIVAEAGLIAHGRGEAFDYILGEKTPAYALAQERAAVALFLLAEYPVLSINGNTAILCPKAIVKFAKTIDAKLEVNLFYRTQQREENIKKLLVDAGAQEILGVSLGESAIEIEEITHQRRILDPEGIYIADVVFVPLEDGDRTMALRKMDKKVVTVDLNPLSRTSVWSSVTIVNHVRRAVNEMVGIAQELKKESQKTLKNIIKGYDNNAMLQKSVTYMANRLATLGKKRLQEG
ncbi:MAG: phosphopantothenate/pantothenate synthetase [Asgard group archaeon]|nr:phosphopantothenate/pantothenate synthetase [Asgard group archaeon]